MYSLESDADRIFRTVTAPEKLSTIDARRVASAVDARTAVPRYKARPVILRPSYDIRSAWHNVTCTA